MKFSYKTSSLISDETIKEKAEVLFPYIQSLKVTANSKNYQEAESSICLPSDNTINEEVNTAVEKVVGPRLKYIVDIGIGGSNLGAKAVYDALYGFFDVLEPDRSPKMFFADTNNPIYLSKLLALLKTKVKSEEEVLINVISKSGTTTETIVNLELCLGLLKEKFPNYKNRLVVTTDRDSKLWLAAQEKEVVTLETPKIVGGRYSIFSTVGLFPLAAAGLDITALRRGAIKSREKALSDNIFDNPTLLSAVILFIHSTQGKMINDNFFFHGELESLGKWYRQLMGESIGKDGKGITPMVSIGSTDLHSMAQLYYGGPHDKITTFVWSKNYKSDPLVPKSPEFSNLVQHIENKKVSEIMMAIIGGVKISYANEEMPFMEVVLDDLTEESIGEFMQFKMIEMMYLSKLLKVNGFDQPHVELYKKEMKKILSGENKL